MEKISNNRCERMDFVDERKPLSEIERSIVTKFRHHLWGKFIKAISDYNMVEEGDKIAVAVSGGKDSLLMAKLFQQLKRMNKIKFDVEFIVADPGYHEDIKEILLDNCKYLNIPIYVYESGIFEIVDRIAKDYPCFMCAKMRRGALYSKAKELGCNKLALGHHFDDVIETVLLNMFYTGCFKTMLPKVKSKNFEGMELIRPLYYIKEHYIECYTKENGILPINCACMVAAKRTGNKRYEIKDLIKELKLKFKDIDKHIFTATQNVNMDAILGWQKNGKKYSYLSFYDENEEE